MLWIIPGRNMNYYEQKIKKTRYCACNHGECNDFFRFVEILVLVLFMMLKIAKTSIAIKIRTVYRGDGESKIYTSIYPESIN